MNSREVEKLRNVLVEKNVNPAFDYGVLWGSTELSYEDLRRQKKRDDILEELNSKCRGRCYISTGNTEWIQRRDSEIRAVESGSSRIYHRKS